MDLPRGRRSSTPDSSNVRRTGRRAQPTDRRLERSVRFREARRQRLAITVGVMILLAVGGIIAFGYYDSFIAPSREKVAEVRDTKITRGELLKWVRIGSAGLDVDILSLTFDALSGMVNAEMIRQAANFQGLSVTDEDIDRELRDPIRGFYPDPVEGQETAPGQSEQEFQDNYRSFLSETNVSDQDYRDLVESGLYTSAWREWLGQERVPTHAEHVEVSWIRLSGTPNADPENPLPTQEEVLERLETEDFNQVASEVTLPFFRFDPDGDGYIGWLPQGAFPQLDDVIFGTEEQDPLGVNEISDPINLPDPVYISSIYIVKSLGEPEIREIDTRMREVLKDQELNDWIGQQRALLEEQGELEQTFDSELVSWIADKLNNR